jgi:hypothetical protein
VRRARRTSARGAHEGRTRRAHARAENLTFESTRTANVTFAIAGNINLTLVVGASSNVKLSAPGALLV